MTTIVRQVVGPVCAILLDHALLNHVGSRVDQCVQEVRSFLVGDDDDRVGIGCQQAVVYDGLDFARVQLIGVFDQSQVGGADHRFGSGQQCAVNTVDDVRRGQRGAITELQVGSQVERPCQAIGAQDVGRCKLWLDFQIVVKLHQAGIYQVDTSDGCCIRR